MSQVQILSLRPNPSGAAIPEGFSAFSFVFCVANFDGLRRGVSVFRRFLFSAISAFICLLGNKKSEIEASVLIFLRKSLDIDATSSAIMSRVMKNERQII